MKKLEHTILRARTYMVMNKPKCIIEEKLKHKVERALYCYGLKILHEKKLCYNQNYLK